MHGSKNPSSGENKNKKASEEEAEWKIGHFNRQLVDSDYLVCLWSLSVALSCRLSRYNYYYYFNVVLFEGSYLMGIQCWFLALSLTCQDLARFSESFNGIMDCRCCKLKILCIFALRNSVLKLLDCLFMQLFRNWWPFHAWFRLSLTTCSFIHFYS